MISSRQRVARLAELAHALGRECPALPDDPDAGGLGRALGAVVDLARPDEVWLALAVMTSVLPDDPTVQRVLRRCALSGPTALAEAAIAAAVDQGLPVRVVTGQTVVDIHHTVATDMATGIQRVARETTSRWFEWHGCLPVAWTDGYQALRLLEPPERRRLPGSDGPTDAATVVVPWRSTVLVPELAADPGRTERYLALARRSGNKAAAIGFDCVPITSAETTQQGFTGMFARNLAAVRYFDRVVAISEAAATEYRGWCRMLDAVGDDRPQVVSVALPEVAAEPSPADLVAAQERFCIGTLPLVLVVGSHEPRKNHLAVLHAAEQLWRSGLRFSLTFIGGNAWNSEQLTEQLTELQALGRPFESAAKIPDPLLWAAYRLARFTVFPSLNEGFGLPVVESLASGTPVITSGYGSMAEIAAGGGALLVDPRDDADLQQAMGRLLEDDDLLDRLRREARARPPRTWDTYAAQAWEQANPWAMAQASG